jgi:5'-methylthioadenosine phosphorylase
MIGIIGGSGLYEIEGVHLREVRHMTTPYGSPSDGYRICDFDGIDAIFLPRHGSAHNIPPHKINYKANIWGFKELRADRVISIGASGGITSQMVPGTIVIPDQILDFTSGRDITYYHGEEGVIHVDFSDPYCPDLRKSLVKAGEKAGISLRDTGTYVCVNGPRLETRAEIHAFSLLGADIVGMTAMPEASLAREAELCYAGVSVVTNFAAGISRKKLTATEVINGMNTAVGQIKTLLREAFTLIPAERSCPCGDAMREAKV